MSALSRQAWRTPLFVAGLLALLIGIGSAIGLVLFAKYSGDPNPNPAGFGVLMTLATPAGIAMIGSGLSTARKAVRGVK